MASCFLHGLLWRYFPALHLHKVSLQRPQDATAFANLCNGIFGTRAALSGLSKKVANRNRLLSDGLETEDK